MSRDEACPHGVMGGCDPCIMRKGDTIAAALAMLPLRGRPTTLTDEAKQATIAAARKWDRLCAAAPEMLALLRDAGQWYCGELPDGTDRREAIAALIKRIDGS